jgi:thiamine biosynthesis lipoprotein
MALIAQSQRQTPAAPTGSHPATPLRKLKFQALGTVCEVQYVAPNGDAQATEFERAAVAWVEAFEAKFSRFRPTSLVSRINAAAGSTWIGVDEEMNQLLALCDTLYAMTKGVLDPTALPLIHLWNWKAERPVIPTADRIAAAKRLVGWTKVRRTPEKIFLPEPGMALDFGGFGKEYAVDLVAQIAVNHGISDVLVDFGHDLRALGVPPGRPAWHIGLEDPKNPGQLAGSIGVTGKGVASSGDYVRCFKIDGRRFGHIIDPRTGWPVDNGCTQTTVIAGTCLQAGVLCTTAFVLGLTAGLEFIQAFPEAEGILVSDHSRAQTRGFFNHVATP